MSDDQSDKPEIKHFLWSGPTPEQEAELNDKHADCHEDSPCRSGEFRTIGAVGVRAVIVDGEKYLNRDDVLSLLARTFTGYEDAHKETHGMEEGPEASMMAMSTFISAQTVNLIGAQLHRLTEGDGESLDVPDTIPDWLTEQSDEPVNESPIEAAIRKAKEAALEAQKAREEGK